MICLFTDVLLNCYGIFTRVFPLLCFNTLPIQGVAEYVLYTIGNNFCSTTVIINLFHKKH